MKHDTWNPSFPLHGFLFFLLTCFTLPSVSTTARFSIQLNFRLDYRSYSKRLLFWRIFLPSTCAVVWASAATHEYLNTVFVGVCIQHISLLLVRFTWLFHIRVAWRCRFPAVFLLKKAGKKWKIAVLKIEWKNKNTPSLAEGKRDTRGKSGQKRLYNGCKRVAKKSTYTTHRSTPHLLLLMPACVFQPHFGPRAGLENSNAQKGTNIDWT